jgi:glycosyltransferase involved in cell wall biosynthesis
MRSVPKKNIGILIGSLEVGGAQTMALQLLKLLTQNGFNAYLFSMDKNKDSRLPGNRSMQKQISRRIILLSQSSVTRGPVIKAISAVMIYSRLVRLIREKEIDVMISFMERANILNLLLKSVKTKIISIRIHVQRLNDKSLLKQWVIKMLYPFLLKRADIVNFNSLESAGSFSSKFSIDKKKISVIHNFCDPDHLTKKSLESVQWTYDYLFEKQVIVSSGRLVRQKGHHELIRAFADLCQTNEQAMLMIIGEGPLRKELVELSRSLGIKERVVFENFHKNLVACLKKSTVFVLSSHVEGFPNVLLEALSIGLPVISTDCSSGPRELLAPDTDPFVKTQTIDYAQFGVLTPPFNSVTINNDSLSYAEKNLSRAIRILLEKNEMRDHYRQNARARAVMFSEKNIQQKWLELFENPRVQNWDKKLS